MSEKIYEHKAQYYETDQMGIIHHSNYIRWFEEARIDLMERSGMGYHSMEEMGIMSPVLSVNCQYRNMTYFNETVLIEAAIKKYNGITMTISYVVKGKDNGEIRCAGETRHCFINREGKPISLKKKSEKFDLFFRELLKENTTPSNSR